MPGLTVKAIDKDLILDDLLGAVTTAQDGSFEVAYDPEDFREFFFDQRPDIFLKVKTPDGETIHETAVRYDAGEEEKLDIRILKD